MSPNLVWTDLCSESIFCSPLTSVFVRSCKFSWFRNSTLHFKPWRNFLLSSWDVNFSEIFSHSLYHAFGPNWTWPYLWERAAWITARFERAEGLFRNFLNRASLVMTRLLRLVSLVLFSLLRDSLSLHTISTLPRSTPAFWTRVFSLLVYPLFSVVGTGNSSSRWSRAFSSFIFSITSNTGSESALFFWRRCLWLSPLGVFDRCLPLFLVAGFWAFGLDFFYSWHILQIWLTVASLTSFKISAGVPCAMVEREQRLCGESLVPNIRAISAGSV